MDKSSFSFDDQIWEKVKVKLKKEVGETAYKNWLKQLQFNSYQEETITFSVQTKFKRLDINSLC